MTFLNASVEEITHGQLPGHLRQSLQTTGVDPGNITIELTESGRFSNPDAAGTHLLPGAT